MHVGKPVTGRKFLGRDRELELLMQYLRMGQSVTIIAPRRFGKTSLVLEALRQLGKEKKYTVFIDVFTNPSLFLLSRAITEEVLDNHGLKHSFSKLQRSVKEVVRSVKLKTTVEEFEFILGFAEPGKQDEWTLFRESLEFIERFAQKHDKQIVCALDEFGEISKFDDNQKIVKLIRSTIQRQQNSVFVFSGSYESVMQSFFVSRKSPFYRMTHIIRLGQLDHAVLLRYFAREARKYAIPVDRHQLAAYLDISGGHPYYAQLMLQQLLLFHIQNNRIPTVEEMLDELLAIEKDYLEKNWQELSSNKEAVFVLRYLSQYDKGVYSQAVKKNINASRALTKLEGMGVLYKEGKSYKFYDPLFELWIARHIN